MASHAPTQPKRLDWLLALVAPGLATLVSLLLSPLIASQNFTMIYLASVLLTAVRAGIRPALLCALLSFLAYNFFFTEPRYSLAMNHREDVLTVFMLALVALVAGHLAARRTAAEASLRQETLEKEREQLRSALLASISHDLKTPLAIMIGSVSSLISLKESLTEAQRTELLQNTLSEAQRLENYIQKLLDMTRLGYGELKLDRDWVGMDDILSVVVKRVRPLLGQIELKLDVPAELPLLHVHAALIEQAIFNALENAIRVSPPGSSIRIRVTANRAWMQVEIQDEGPGIPPQDWENIFDRFYSRSSDAQPAGSGLGLAICRGILGAHGGSARVLRSSPAGGTRMCLSLPLDPERGTEGSGPVGNRHNETNLDDDYPSH